MTMCIFAHSLLVGVKFEKYYLDIANWLINFLYHSFIIMDLHNVLLSLLVK